LWSAAARRRFCFSVFPWRKAERRRKRKTKRKRRQAAALQRAAAMKTFLKKLQYGARTMLAQRGGEAEKVSLPGRDVIVRHGGDGPPFVYLHSSLGEGSMW